MSTTFLSLGDAIERMKYEAPVKKYRSSRNKLMEELHQFYKDDKYILDRQAYAKWLFRNKLKPSPENIQKWKKTSGEYYPEITPASFASFWLGHIPTDHLYYLISIAKDKKNRKESFNKWLFWALKN